MKTLARQRDKAEILQRLSKVRPESVRRWGRMSAHQMVCHLSDAFRWCSSETCHHAIGPFPTNVVKGPPSTCPSMAGRHPHETGSRSGSGRYGPSYLQRRRAARGAVELITAQPARVEWPASDIRQDVNADCPALAISTWTITSPACP